MMFCSIDVHTATSLLQTTCCLVTDRLQLQYIAAMENGKYCPSLAHRCTSSEYDYDFDRSRSLSQLIIDFFNARDT